MAAMFMVFLGTQSFAQDAAEPEAEVDADSQSSEVLEPWGRHVVPSSTVSVELPGEVEHRENLKRVLVGTVVTRTLVAEVPGAWAAATVIDPPDSIMFLASQGTIFRQTRKSILKDAQGTEVSYEPVHRGGRDGWRLTFTTEKDTGRAQVGVSEMYTFDGLVVTLIAVAHSEAPGGLALTFLESVRWE